MTSEDVTPPLAELIFLPEASAAPFGFWQDEEKALPETGEGRDLLFTDCAITDCKLRRLGCAKQIEDLLLSPGGNPREPINPQANIQRDGDGNTSSCLFGPSVGVSPGGK